MTWNSIVEMLPLPIDTSLTSLARLLAMYAFALVAATGVMSAWLRRRRRMRVDKQVVAFFHPFCMSGGGGERVLWAGIRSLQRAHDNISIVVYTGDAQCDHYRQHVREHFGIELPGEVRFVRLRFRFLLEPTLWPMFTMAGQSTGSLISAFEALVKLVPDVLVDTTGWAFVMPLARYLAGCSAVAYVHYPTISSDMIQRLSEASFNNAERIARFSLLSYIKLAYYRVFAVAYWMAGQSADVVMVNSTWTYNHMAELWGSDSISIVYPPCGEVDKYESTLQDDFLFAENKKRILSIAQFRPEKNHTLQLLALRRLFDDQPDRRDEVELVLVGSDRGGRDRGEIVRILDRAAELKLDRDSVSMSINVTEQQLKQHRRGALIGIHSMRDEHFGISIVESMAAGLIMIAHNSGGPKLDILARSKTDNSAAPPGFLCDTAASYAATIEKILRMDDAQLDSIRKAARQRASAFSDEIFDANFSAAFQPVLRREK